MTTSYPITLPSEPGFKRTTIQPVAAVGQAKSPFSFSQQTQDFGHHQYLATFVLPPMNESRVDNSDVLAKEWDSILTSLRKTKGRFKAGPAYNEPFGEAKNTKNAVTVDSINSDNDQIDTSGWPTNTNDLLLPGDWIEANGELKQVGPDASVDSDGSGNATIDVEPPFRADPTGESVTYRGPTTKWRLTDNNPKWSIEVITQRETVIEAQEYIT